MRKEAAGRPHACGGRYAVLGHPVAHSLSPRMHAANFAALGIEARYEALDVPPEQLEESLAALRSAGFCGLNLTIPLKAHALKLVNEVAPSAELLGGVNTILYRTDGTTIGHNTDGFGFLASLRDEGVASLRGLRVMVLGCGGAGRALALSCAEADVAAIVLANRTEARAHELAVTLRSVAPQLETQIVSTSNAAWESAARSCDLIVHTTSQGLHAGEKAALSSAAFRSGQLLFDAIYTAPQTAIMQNALAAGAKAINGLGMLLHQGAQSFRIWFDGREPDLAAMRRAIMPPPR